MTETRHENAYPQRYVHRPTEVEAAQVSAGRREELAQWCGGTATETGVTVPTLGGEVHAGDGDWIVRSESGHHHAVPGSRFGDLYRRDAGPRGGMVESMAAFVGGRW